MKKSTLKFLLIAGLVVYVIGAFVAGFNLSIGGIISAIGLIMSSISLLKIF